MDYGTEKERECSTIENMEILRQIKVRAFPLEVEQ